MAHDMALSLALSLSLSQTSELGVTEHVEGDPCKFALWVGRTPTSDNKIVLKVGLSLSPVFRPFLLPPLPPLPPLPWPLHLSQGAFTPRLVGSF